MQARGGHTIYVPTAIVPLGAAQKVVVQQTAEEKTAYLKFSRDPSPMLVKHNLFQKPPDVHGASHAAAEGALIVAEALMAHNYLLPESETRAHIAMQAAVPEMNRSLWSQAWVSASPTTTGHGEGSKFWCAMRIFLEGYTTITEKSRMLQAMDDFRYEELGWAPTRAAIDLLFRQYDHAVATTQQFPYLVHRMPDMSQGQRVDWVLEKADAFGIEWLRDTATSSGAETITDLATALRFWSHRVPRREMLNFRNPATNGSLCAVRADVLCYACGKRGHYRDKCPEQAGPAAGEAPPPRRPHASYPFVQPTQGVALHTLQQQTSMSMAALEESMQVLRNTQEGITLAMQMQAPDFRASMSTSELGPTTGMQSASGAGLHYLRGAPYALPLPSVAAMAAPNAVNDLRQQHGIHVYEDELYWNAE